jgi:hypothetical protein
MTLVCQKGGSAFSDYPIIDGKRRHLHGRRQCLECLPFKPRHSPRFYHARPPRMLVCQLCGDEFPSKQVIDGKLRSLYRRKLCLSCSPFGQHNTSKRPIGRGPDADAVRRKRRTQSSYRCQRRRRVERKRRIVEIRGGRCEDCGYDVSAAALEFHHRNSKTKEFGLGNFNGSWERLVAEAAKCDLLCANCHRRRHNYRGSLVAQGKKARAIELMGGRCGGCSGVVPDSLFEFHHWDARQKKFGISRDGLSRPWEAIAAELLKCVMLCANCHREVHAGVRQLERDSSSILPIPPMSEIAAA